jgi:hypothetical protein
MKKIFWVLALGAVASAAMAVGLGRANDVVRKPDMKAAWQERAH